jgi:hypothetical protein
MFRKLVCTTFVMTVAIGLVGADEFTAIIKKVDGDKVTFAKFDFKNFKKDKDAKVEDMTLPVASDAKITKGKFNKDKKIEPGEPIEGGLKNDIFTKIEEKKGKGAGGKGGFGFGGGLFSTITTSEDGKTITAITVTQFGGKKKDDKKAEDKK